MKLLIQVYKNSAVHLRGNETKVARAVPKLCDYNFLRKSKSLIGEAYVSFSHDLNAVALPSFFTLNARSLFPSFPHLTTTLFERKITRD